MQTATATAMTYSSRLVVLERSIGEAEVAFLVLRIDLALYRAAR